MALSLVRCRLWETSAVPGSRLSMVTLQSSVANRRAMYVTSAFCPPNLFLRLPNSHPRHPCTRRRRSPWKNYPRTPPSALSSSSSPTLPAKARPSRPTRVPNKCRSTPSSTPRAAPTKPSSQFSDYAFQRPCSTHRIRLRSRLVGYVPAFSFARSLQVSICLRFD